MTETKDADPPGREVDENEPVYLIDEIELRPDVTDEFLAAFRADYLPGAVDRGMQLLHTWVTPPERPAEMGATVLFVWVLEGVPGFWRMRSQNAAPEVAAWWRKCESYCVRRTRRFAVTPESQADFAAAGRGHA